MVTCRQVADALRLDLHIVERAVSVMHVPLVRSLPNDEPRLHSGLVPLCLGISQGSWQRAAVDQAIRAAENPAPAAHWPAAVR